MFLPDRYVKGECPICHTADQYGDSCENCGSTYTPDKLINPVSTISGTPPVWRESEHYFFKLGDFTAVLRAVAGRWRRATARGARETRGVVRSGPAGLGHFPRCPLFRLRDSRRARKIFLRLVRCTHRLPRQLQGVVRPARPELRRIPQSRQRHRAVSLHRQGHQLLPQPVLARGACTARDAANRAACSCTGSSRSTARRCRSRAALSSPPGAISSACQPKPLRFYFAGKLGAGVDDIDLSLDDFVARVNSDVVGKLVNIASRCAGFIQRAGGKLAAQLPESAALRRVRGGARHDRASSTTRASTRRRCAKSWASPTGRISMSMPESPGRSPRIRRRPPRCSPSARRASICSACS